MYPRCLSILLCCALLMLAGCDKDNNPPRIIVLTPPSDSLAGAQQGRIISLAPFRRDPMIKVQFNEALLESSIPADAITLEYAGQPIAGRFEFMPSINAVGFEPDEPLFFLRQYDVKLASGISDLKGNRIQSEFEWSFWVTDGFFSGTILIENQNTGSATEPKVKFGPGGHGQVIWSQADGGVTNIWARALRNFNLESPLRIETEAGNANSPQVAVDDNGNAVAVWSQSDGTNWRIQANRFTPASGEDEAGTWGSAEPISNDGTDASAPQIAVDSNGNAIAVWIQPDGRVYANGYNGDWGTPQPIDANNGEPSGPQIVMDSNNNATAVWAQNSRIYANRHVAGAWGTAEPIDNGTGTATAAPQIAVDSEGSVTVVWSQSDGTYASIWTNRFTGSGWGNAITIENLDGNANVPQIAMNPGGTAAAVWSQSSPTAETRSRIRSAHFNPADASGPSGGWSMDADPIDNFSRQIYVPAITDQGVSTEPRIAIDGDGNILVVWTVTARINDVDRSHIAANRYRGPSAHESRRGWNSAVLIENDMAPDNGDAVTPHVALAPDFTGVAVWSKKDNAGLAHIQASAFR
jgi:hypothetical protein